MNKIKTLIQEPSIRVVIRFFALTLLISLPFYAFGYLADSEVLPRLPLSSAMVVVPAAVALLFSRRGSVRLEPFAGVGVSAGRWSRVGWYVIAAVTPPVILVLSFVWLRAAGTGIPLPRIAPGRVPLLLLLFLFGATAEEIGWSGFATEPIARRCGYLTAALIIAAIAIVWHVIPLLQAGRDLSFVAWWSLKTTAHRVMIVYIFAATGRSTLSASIFHAMSNLSWQLFPVNGSFYDPMSAGVLALVGAVVMVVLTRRSISAFRGSRE